MTQERIKSLGVFLIFIFPYLSYSQSDTSIYDGLNLDAVEINTEALGSVISLKDPKLKTIISRAELKKAACCNLSESFETNPSIDVSITDAVTGTRQIQLFGLAGKYAQIQVEMTPLVRGLLANSGLSYIPGAWIHSIQLTKGIGSVSNGFESMTGQINVELLKPENIIDDIVIKNSAKLRVNNYINQGGRIETNLIYGKRISDKWSLGILGHASGRSIIVDNNKDGFADNPIGYQLNGMVRARYFGQNGWEGLFTIHTLEDQKIGGQISNNLNFPISSNPWRSNMSQNRFSISSKTGWVNPKNPNQSIGVILHGYRQSMIGNMGSSDDALNQKELSAHQIGGVSQFLFRQDWNKISHTGSVGIFYDNYDINFNAGGYLQGYNRPFVEQNIGISSEWTWTPNEFLTLVAGGRFDWHSIILNSKTRVPFSPRIHARIAPNDKNVFRLVFGEGFRMALPITEEWGRVASNREIRWDQYGSVSGGDQLSSEESTNAGISYTGNFIFNYMPGSITANIHGTWFNEAVIHDYWSNRMRYIYPDLTTSNESEFAMISKSAGISSNYKLDKKTEIRLAYRYQNVVVRNQIHGLDPVSILMPAAFVAKHRALINLSRNFMKSWNLDITVQYHGEQPIPSIQPLAPGLDGKLIGIAPAHQLLNFQFRKTTRKGDFYLGVENALNFQQQNPIDGAVNINGEPMPPGSTFFTDNFDATRVWGPIFGRMIYFGLNFKLIE